MGLGFMAHARSSLGVSSQASVSTSESVTGSLAVSPAVLSFLGSLLSPVGVSKDPPASASLALLCPTQIPSLPLDHPSHLPPTLRPTHIISSLLLPRPFQDLSLIRIFWAFLSVSVPPMHNTKGAPFQPLRHQTQKSGRAGLNWVFDLSGKVVDSPLHHPCRWVGVTSWPTWSSPPAPPPFS